MPLPSFDPQTGCLCHELLDLLGCAVVTPKGAYLFTDGRYFLQAEKQLDQYVHNASFDNALLKLDLLWSNRNWTLMKQGLPGKCAASPSK